MHPLVEKFIEEVHTCPHCSERMSCCESPPVHVGDGLGWGSEILFICLNDMCPLFLNGWAQIENQYGHHASYRYMELPGSRESNVMMVGNADAFKAAVINTEELKSQNIRYQKEKDAVKALDTCVVDKNLEPVMTLLLDEAADRVNRSRALEFMVRLNDLECIDPIRNHAFRDVAFENECNLAISSILKANYRKECPFCFEIIKAQAVKCLHCGETLR